MGPGFTKPKGSIVAVRLVGSLRGWQFLYLPTQTSSTALGLFCLKGSVTQAWWRTLQVMPIEVGASQVLGHPVL